MNFRKLSYLQKQYAVKYAEEGGTNFEHMVDEILYVVEQKQAGTGW